MLKLLIDHGANVHVKSDEGTNLVHILVCALSNKSLAYVLDMFRFNLKEETTKGYDAFDLCRKCGNREGLTILNAYKERMSEQEEDQFKVC